jgi:hypothetical protein
VPKISRNLDNNTAQHITYQELIQAVADASDSDTRYGFFLGAGASVESGIPVAKELSEGWLKTIKNNKGANDNDADLKKWEEEPAKYYGEIFSRRFRANLSAGHKELQQYINRETPSIGYLFLAQILTNTKLYHSLLVLYYKVLYNSLIYYSVVCYSILY